MVTASDVHQCAGIDRRPGPVDGAELLRFGLICTISIATASAVCGFILRYQPLSDPVDVVGLPLIRGYTEASEQFSLLAASLTVVVVGILLDRIFPARLPISERAAWSLVGMGSVLFIALVSRNWVMFPAYAIVMGVAHLAGRRAGPQVKPSPGGLCLAVIAQIVLGRPWREIVVDLRTVGSPGVLLSFTLLASLLGYVARGRWSDLTERTRRLTNRASELLSERPGIVLTAVVVWLLLDCTATDRVIIAAFAVSAILGARCGARTGQELVPDRTLVVWIGLLLLAPFIAPFVFTAHDFNQIGLNQLLTLLGLGLAVAALAQRTMVKHGWSLSQELQSGSWRDHWWCVVPAVFFVAALGRNVWTGAWLLAICAVLICRRPRWRPGLRSGALLAFGLLFACCPEIGPADPPDRFHDGQIMSALFELQKGRLLFSEVFPLRNYHLALAAIGQTILPPTLEGFHATQHLVMFLHVGGAAFLVYAWTRSGAWSLLAGLLFLLSVTHSVMTIDLGSRHATQLWLAGFALEILRHHGLKRIVLAMLLGILAAVVGYDGFIPVIAAVAPAIAISDPQVPGELRFWWRRAATAVQIEAVLMASPTVVLVVWQSPRSAGDFWTLLLDSARNMSTHYGQPLTSEAIRHMAPCFLALSLWSMIGVLCWARLSLFQRAGGLTLLIHFLLVLLRGTGRGGIVNFEAGDLPLQILQIIGAFECLSAIRRWSGRAMWNDRTLIALAASGVLVVRLPAVLSDPLTLVHQLQSLSPVEQLRQSISEGSNNGVESHPHRSPTDDDATLVRSLVGPDESFWAVEDALANYLCERRNPTRHAMAYTICSPAEQRRAIRDLQGDPPPLITFRPFAIDGIPFTLRYYLISQYLFAHYRPSDHSGFLEERRDGWSGFEHFPAEWTFTLPLERLAARWGTERLPKLTVDQSESLEFVRGEELPEIANLVGTQEQGSRAPHAGPPLGAAERRAESDNLQSWVCDADFRPSQFNYLVIRFPEEGVIPAGTRWEGRLTFASPGEDWDTASELTWTIVAGDRTFLLPVGCSPGWAWRASIARLQLVLPANYGGAAPDVELLWIDELDMATSSDSSLK